MLGNSTTICRNNPYLSKLAETPEIILRKKTEWLQQLPQHYQRAQQEDMLEHTHARFAFFEEMAQCQPNQVHCIGGPCRKDESKIACGTSYDTLTEGCIVYSIGGNNKWTFELDILQRTPCEVHTFDCTGPITRFTKPTDPRIHFHHICLGSEPKAGKELCRGIGKCGETWTLADMASKLGHNQIDLYKMDIEGFEWPVFQSLFHSDNKGDDNAHLPMQLLVEIHYKTQFSELGPRRKDFKYPKDIVDLQKNLLELGYFVTNRDDNRACKHCTELTLMRVQC